MIDAVTSRMYEAVYARYAQPAGYTDGDGNARRVAAVVTHDLQQYAEVAKVTAASAIIAVRKSEVAERPRRDDVFALDSGDTYYVDTVVLSDGFEHRCIAHVR